MLSHLLIAALAFSTATNFDEPTPQPILDRIQTRVCDKDFSRVKTVKRMLKFESNHGSLPDDVWETLMKCDE